MNILDAKAVTLNNIHSGNATLWQSGSGLGKSSVAFQLFCELRDEAEKNGETMGFGVIFAATQTPPDIIGIPFKGSKTYNIIDYTTGQPIERTVTITDASIPLWMMMSDGRGGPMMPAFCFDKCFLLIDEYGMEVKVPILKMRQSASTDVRRIADFIYEKVFFHYTAKQWGFSPEELDPSVSARVPILLSRDDRYFQDSFQAMPAEGYTPIFEKMLLHPGIEVRLGQTFEGVDGAEPFDRVVFTGPIDQFFGHVHGRLPYRSIRFDMVTTASPEPIQRATVENYPTPANEHPYTRSTEFRRLTGQSDIGFTTQAFEYSEAYEPGKNEPYYPIPREENQRIYQKYAAEAAKLGTVHFAGRLGDYTYYNMDQAVGRALACFEKEIVGGKAR